MNEAPNQGDQSLIRKPPQSVVENKQSKIASFDVLADEFASICSENLDKELTPKQIKEKLVEKGFPAGLASYLGSSLLERIIDARATLVVAATKPKLRDSLVATVKDETIEYFKAREVEMIKFFEASENPKVYLKILSDVFAHIDAGNFSDQEVISAFEAIEKLTEQGAEKLTRPITQYVLEFCLQNGLKSAKMVSDTEIQFPNAELEFSSSRDFENNLFKHLQKKFPKTHAVMGGKDGILGGHTGAIRVSYSI